MDDDARLCPGPRSGQRMVENRAEEGVRQEKQQDTSGRQTVLRGDQSGSTKKTIL